MEKLEVEEKNVRKLRKKLRQIENLENLSRPLNEEEEIKVQSRDELRVELNEILDKMAKRKSDAGDHLKIKKCKEESNHLNKETQLEVSVISQNTEKEKSNLTSSATEDLQRTESCSNSNYSTQDSVQNIQVNISCPAKAEDDAWKEEDFDVSEFEPSIHEDLVLCCDLEDNLVIDSSRDTTLSVWNIEKRNHVGSLRGHSLAVTSCQILPKSVNKFFQVDSSSCLAISGSLDCSLKVWNLATLEMIRNVYVYNGVKTLKFGKFFDGIAIGTESGKLEIFSIENIAQAQTNQAIFSSSVNAHEDCLNSLDICKDLLCTGCQSGMIKVWKVCRNNGKYQIKSVYDCDDIRTAEDDQVVHSRSINTISFLSESKVAYGDNGCNLKCLDLDSQILHKIPNHTSDLGLTDALQVIHMENNQQYLLASSFNLDTGYGHINIFSLEENKLPSYICSWIDERTGRISYLAAGKAGILSCGRHLKLWQKSHSKVASNRNKIIKPSILPLLQEDVWDSGSSDESEKDEVETAHTFSQNCHTTSNSSWFSYCTIS